jgi:Xaa-Pro dipeptidase
MEERGIDVLLLSDPGNLYYSTGYDAWSFYVPQAVLIEKGSDRLAWVGSQTTWSLMAMSWSRRQGGIP